jgi:broad specificity phosphatase PhoE
MIVFIRHAETKIDPKTPTSQWCLTDTAYQASRQLARELEKCKLKHIVTSEEFKAKETGRVIAEELGLTWETANNLHEHERKGIPFMEAEVWQQTIKDFFAKPDEFILGKQETANQALKRFSQTVDTIVAVHPEGIAIVTHGSVLSLFIAKHNALNAYTFWQALKMPDRVALDADFKLLNVY